MGTKEEFMALLRTNGVPCRYRRADSVIPCPCQTPEGFRDPEWHDANPEAPLCDERGFLHDPSATTDLIVKAFIEPSQTTRGTRLAPEYLAQMFGEFQEGDHIGIFPESWEGILLQFYDWSQSGEDFIQYNGRFYNVVASNLFMTPDTGEPRGHWECGLRLISTPLGEPV